jgi:hypothetical protein
MVVKQASIRIACIDVAETQAEQGTQGAYAQACVGLWVLWFTGAALWGTASSPLLFRETWSICVHLISSFNIK